MNLEDALKLIMKLQKELAEAERLIEVLDARLAAERKQTQEIKEILNPDGRKINSTC